MMTSKTSKGFKTLQGRLVVLLLLPVSIIIFTGGVVSFLYTRNMVLDQWNESALLKLSRAAHYIEMRLMKPIEVIETLLQLSLEGRQPLSLLQIAGQLENIEGIVDVSSRSIEPLAKDRQLAGAEMVRHGMMRFRRSRLSGISDPIFDSDLGHETVTLSITLMDSLGWPSGELNLKISFDYLLKEIRSLGWWQSDMACIVDQQGQYMVHTNMTMKGRRTLGDENDPLELAIYEKMQHFPSGTLSSKGHPPDMIAGFHRLEQVPWTIILFAKGKKIFEPIIDYRNAFGAASLVLILIVLILIRHHVCHIVDQIKALSKNADLVSKGIYGSAVESKSRDEIGFLVANYNEMVQGLKQRDFIRDTFGRYVDPKFAKSLLQHPDAGKLGGKRREVVLMMSDIRGFTPLAETLSPEKIIRILNQYFSHMIQIIQEHNGIIVDFFGDAILVFFDPLSENVCDRALCAVQCALKMQVSMDEVNLQMAKEGLPELSMGIGIHSGPVVVGNIGSKTRAKYGVVGSAVNITSRIQAKALKNEVLISDAVFECVKNEISIIRTVKADLKGVENPMSLKSLENFLKDEQTLTKP